MKKTILFLITLLAASTASATTFFFASNATVAGTGDVSFNTQTDTDVYDFNLPDYTTVNGLFFDLTNNGDVSLAYRIAAITENETDVTTSEDDPGTMTFTVTLQGIPAFVITSTSWNAPSGGSSDLATVIFGNTVSQNFGVSGIITAAILWSETDQGATTNAALSNTNTFGTGGSSNDTDYAYVRFTLTQADAPPQQGDIPEPSTFGLLGAGLAGLGLAARRRNKK